MALLAAASFRILPALGVLQMCLVNFRSATPIINTTYNLLFNSTQIENNKKIGTSNEKIFHFKNDLKIENISFQYDQNQVLFDDANLQIKFGEIVGIEGKSGTGKSTLINIICGLKNIDKGKVLVDGVDINKNLKGWQKNLGYVPQNIFLKDNTIESNIIFGERNTKDREKKRFPLIIKNLEHSIGKFRSYISCHWRTKNNPAY